MIAGGATSADPDAGEESKGPVTCVSMPAERDALCLGRFWCRRCPWRGRGSFWKTFGRAEAGEEVERGVRALRTWSCV